MNQKELELLEATIKDVKGLKTICHLASGSPEATEKERTMCSFLDSSLDQIISNLSKLNQLPLA